MARAKNDNTVEEQQEAAEEQQKAQALREAGQDVGQFDVLSAEEVEDLREKDAQILRNQNEGGGPLAPLMASSGIEVEDVFELVDPNAAIKDQNPAQKIDGSELVEVDPTMEDPDVLFPLGNGVFVTRAELKRRGRSIPPVEYGFDLPENTNVDPIETDGILDLKDKNRRENGVIDPNLNADLRASKYNPAQTLSGRRNLPRVGDLQTKRD